jgi:predicted HAD superfamily phosphohydrolase YqeG
MMWERYPPGLLKGVAMKYAAVFFDWGDTLSVVGKKSIDTNDWVGSMLKKLYMASYRLAIISNTHRYQDAQWIRHRLADVSALTYFECIISSALYGYHKPDVKIFQKALDFMELDPTKVVMVGDHEHCDGAAQLLGMSFLHVKSGEHWEQRLYDLLGDAFPSCRKLSRISEFGLIENKLIVKMRHLSESIKAGDHILLDQDEYAVLSASREFEKEDVLHTNKEEYVEFKVRRV